MNGSGRFEVYEGKDSNWYWRLKALNGQIVAVCEGKFDTKETAKRSCESVQIAAGSPVDGINIIDRSGVELT